MFSNYICKTLKSGMILDNKHLLTVLVYRLWAYCSEVTLFNCYGVGSICTCTK